jgi:hypothetical protein
MGHWFLLLPSRRYAYMFIGLGCLLIAAVSMLTGKTPVRFHGLVSRDEEAKRFREAVVAYFIGGLFFIGLSLVGFYLNGPPYLYF